MTADGLPEAATVCALCETDALGDATVIDGKTYCEDCCFHAECHDENLPATERADCSHLRICKGCAEEHYCLDCEREEFWWSSVDRAWDAKKEGAWDV